MATIISAAPGNWGNTNTWTGSVVPTIGDTAEINHQVVLDASYSVGGILPASTGCLVGVGPNTGNRLAVGGGQICFVAKGVVVT